MSPSGTWKAPAIGGLFGAALYFDGMPVIGVLKTSRVIVADREVVVFVKGATPPEDALLWIRR